MNDLTIIRDPELALAVIDAVDAACQQPRRGVLNRPQTHAIIYATPQQHLQNHHTWKLLSVQQKATLNTPTDPLNALGATLRGKAHRRAELLTRLYAMHAMHHELTTLICIVVELKLA